MKLDGFIGPAYTLKSVNVDCQSCINLYPELNEMMKGSDQEIAWLRSTPGLDFIFTIGAGPIRLIHVDQPPKVGDNPVTRLFIVSGNTVYKVQNNFGWVTTSLGTIGTSSGPVSAASDPSFSLGRTVFVDGVHSYLYERTDSGGGVYVDSFGDFNSFGFFEVPNATQVIVVDGYYLYVNNTANLWCSGLNDINIDPLSFAAAEGDPDNLIALISNQRDVWLFNERSTELFNDTGNADFPFERVSGGFIEKGILAPFSAAKIDGVVFWLGRDEFGQGVIYSGQGLVPQRISTHAIETAIQGYSTESIVDAFAYTYQSGGHSFYVLNFNEATWVYDLSTNLWHQRAYLLNGVLQRHRIQYHAFVPEYGIHMVGDYSNTNIYKFNDDNRTDNGDPIKRLRSSPHVNSRRKRIFYNQLQIDMETGVGLDGGVFGSDPTVVMQYSDDSGRTWSKEYYAPAGKIGLPKTRVIWRRLGQSRDRVFRIVMTDPVNVALLSADIDIEVGSN